LLDKYCHPKKEAYITFLVSPSKYSSTLNKKIRQKLLFHSYRSVSWLVWYGITDGSKLWEIFVFLFLRVENKNNSCIRETQENSIEFLVQSSLPYILLLLMVSAHYCAPYPNDHVYDMRLTCVVHAVWCHFIPEPSTPFF